MPSSLQRALAGRGLTVDVADVGLLCQVVLDAGSARVGARFPGHVLVAPVPAAGFLELGHLDTDHA